MVQYHGAMQELRRIPSLDGWRFVAIACVLVDHSTAVLGREPFGGRVYHLGQHGVQLFFVLSGFLITLGLLRQERVDLTAFYTRRAFRILPTVLVYLGVLGLVGLATHRATLGDLASCLLFYRNYIPETAANTLTGHLWSLSVEEQFYLLWPLAVLLGRRSAMAVAAVTAVASAGLAVGFAPYYAQGLRYMFSEVRVSGLLVGCLLAYAVEHETVRAWVRRWGSSIMAAAIPVLVFDALHYHVGVIPLHESVTMAALVAATSLCPGSWLTRALEWEHVKLTGQASYSLYVWQGLLFRPNVGVWGVLALAAVFPLSWRLVELPCIRLGKRVLARRAAGRVRAAAAGRELAAVPGAEDCG